MHRNQKPKPQPNQSGRGKVMYVTFDEYTRFGYNLIPREVFERYIINGGGLAERYTLGRVSADFLASATNLSGLVERNKRGICELAELVYKRERLAIGEAGVPIRSFSNEGYSETLVDIKEQAAAFEYRLGEVLSTYFTPEQLCRRAGG